MSESEETLPAEATLLARAASGDGDALSVLLKRYGPRVRRELSIGDQWRSVLEADDVMQVTYLEAFLRISSFTPTDSGTFLGWLRRIAQNNLRDAVKALERAKRPPPCKRVDPPRGKDSFEVLYEYLGSTSTTPSRVAAKREAKDLLEIAIRKLPPDYATAVRLHDLEGCTGPEVAAAMGRSRGAIFMLLGRAHDQLREVLASESTQ